ncbi:hypothetical protein [Bordetella genomosp. 9]|uniref:Nucleotidyl transferase AbiEii/AbiGii toxin family protein n=1 Tax=Bordetella genomosp. 9 TaxID=1416803 RepID=A0A1W6YW85_9BORD|nr:hypothetical protein [Bordetella genomosp. 9]ARP85261.1 hypothetical protein CAL13_02790 [Bordetella genomosp. 9]ARP89248.1 hypothetical protein CAL14_02175 [Bordetella genomosp. 9]
MSEAEVHKRMIRHVAGALGPELLGKVAFVGGCTTGLLITDDFSREQVRHTKDVDLIIHVVGYAEWAEVQNQLRSKGFKDILSGDAPICALQLGELRVDFMPDDARLLGFSNRWYSQALSTAEPYAIGDDIVIRLVTPPYFVATKLEAYSGRGNNDPLGSQDVEDILNLCDGREALVNEMAQAPADLRNYVSSALRRLLEHPSMDHAIQSCARGNVEQEKYLYGVIDSIVALGA